jgi:hypothetical protein
MLRRLLTRTGYNLYINFLSQPRDLSDSYATAKVQAGVGPVWVSRWLREFVKKTVAFLTVENPD